MAGAGGGTAAAVRYEFLMQVRRPAVWIVLLLAAGGAMAASHLPWHVQPGDVSAPMVSGDWAFALQSLMPAALGCLLADRGMREARLGVDELLGAVPASPSRLLLGKFLGATAATAVPIFAMFLAGSAYLAASHGAAVLPAALAAFALVNVPGLLFVAAFSIGVPTVMPTALYQFLFVGYWFWGNFLPTGFHIPTISHTILTPVGRYALAGFFHTPGAGMSGPVSATTGALSILVLLATTAAALWLTGLRLSTLRGPGTGGRAAPATAAWAEDTGRPRRLLLFRYEARILGLGAWIAPLVVLAVFGVFAVLTALVGGRGGIVPRILTAALEVGLSLGAGLAAARCVTAEPAAELHLSLPRGYRSTAARRWMITVGWSCLLGIVMTCALAATGGLLSDEPLALSQLVWASPTLCMSALAAALALGIRSRAGSVGVVTGIWLAEFIAHGLFRSLAWLRPALLFATTFARGASWWLANRLDLVAAAVVLAAAAWVELGNGEAFVGHTQE